MSKIIACGDSFVYGSELRDCDLKINNWNNYSNLTFTKLLSGNHDYHLIAKPGVSNQRNCRLLQNEILKNKPNDVGVIFFWTWAFRFELFINNDWFQVGPWHTDLKENIGDKKLISSIRQQVVDLNAEKFVDEFWKHQGNFIHPQAYIFYNQVFTMQEFLKSRNIPYLFLNISNDFNINLEFCPEEVKVLHDAIDWSHWFFFSDNLGFFEWAKHNNYNIGEWGHPLEEAHADAARLIKPKFKELVLDKL